MATSLSGSSSGPRAGRGQMWLIDAMVSGTFITLILFVMLGIQGQFTDKYVQQDSEVSFANSVLAASDALVLTPGRPANWDYVVISDSNLESFGLASSSNVISTAKALRLVAINATNYTAVKAALGLAASNVSIEIMLLGNVTPLYSFGTKSSNTSRSTVFERLAVMDDNRPVLVRLEVG